MQKELEKSIEKFNKSQASLEAYQAISDFVKIIIAVPEFIEQVEKEGETIRNAQIELNADKGWNYGLKGKELKQHNERRAKKHAALFQLDPMFPLRNLHNVHLGIKAENITDNSDWLFHGFSPDEPLPEADKKEYQLFLDKLYKKILPFLEKENGTIPIEQTNFNLDFNIEKSVLYLGKKEVKISSRTNERTGGHSILTYIFSSEDGLDDTYEYSEIASDDPLNDYNSEPNSWRKYQHACEYTNEKIRKKTGFADFFVFSTGKTGTVRINEKYLK